MYVVSTAVSHTYLPLAAAAAMDQERLRLRWRWSALGRAKVRSSARAAWGVWRKAAGRPSLCIQLWPAKKIPVRFPGQCKRRHTT